jgi:hypothetical protein
MRNLLTVLAVVTALLFSTNALAQPQAEVTPEPAHTVTQTIQQAEPTVTPEPEPEEPSTQLPNHEITPGLNAQQLQPGITANITTNGITFAYVGKCVNNNTKVNVWGNNGSIQTSNTSYCTQQNPSNTFFNSIGWTWSENTRHTFCTLGVSAYRGEAYGNYTQWIEIPNEYKQCETPQQTEQQPTIDTTTPPTPTPEIPLEQTQTQPQ